MGRHMCAMVSPVNTNEHCIVNELNEYSFQIKMRNQEKQLFEHLFVLLILLAERLSSNVFTIVFVFNNIECIERYYHNLSNSSSFFLFKRLTYYNGEEVIQ